MEVTLTSEQETELGKLETSIGKPRAELIKEAVDSYIASQRSFLEAVDQGLASLDRGESLSHGHVGKRLDSLLGSE